MSIDSNSKMRNSKDCASCDIHRRVKKRPSEAAKWTIETRSGFNLIARRVLALSFNATLFTHLMLILGTVAQKHPILDLHKQQQQSSSSYTKSPSVYQNGTTSRPLDRPSLSLVGGKSQNSSNSLEGLPDGAADWFMMGGGDLVSDEGRHHLAFASDDSEPVARPTGRRNNMTRRMAEVKQRKHSTTGKNNSSKSMFDDEQQSAESADSNEVYDDVDENGSNMAGTQKDPECAAHGRYYCTFKEDYPLKLVTEVTKYYKWPLEKLFRDLHAQIMPKLAQDSTGNLVCDSITRVVRPGWARNTNERWLVVINTDNYHQYVTEVVCQYGTNSRCNFIPPCYYSSCQQRYNTQKLLVIDPTNPYRGPFLSEFLFPSCCVCYVPSASDSFQDKYRSSPATIYQRTMQQEAASNLNPPQFRPPGLSLLEAAFSSGSSSNVGSNQAAVNGGGGAIPLPGGATGTGQTDSAASSSIHQQTLMSNNNNNNNGAVSSNQQQQGQQQASGGQATNQPAGPGEIRRAGDHYRRQLKQQQQQYEESARQARQVDPPADFTDSAAFPRLGLSDSLIHPQSSSKE